tara:strand:+ start:34 stop:468 length:435 start_codon:yes stop_codon:yes gene_type:complete
MIKKMNNKYKIVLNYIKDLSVEIPSPEALITSRNNIGKYQIKVNVTSKPLRLKMIEVVTKLTYADPTKNKHKAFFEIEYATIIDILDSTLKKNDLEKIILCDLQTEIYPELEKKFLNILKNSGFPNLKFGQKIDFEKLYKQKFN